MDEFIMNIGKGPMRRLISKLITRLLKEKTKIGSLDVVVDKLDGTTKDGKLMVVLQCQAYVDIEELTDKIRKGELL